MVSHRFRRLSSRTTLERALAVAMVILLAAYLAVLFLQPSAVGRGGR